MLRNTESPIFWMTQRTTLCERKQMYMNCESKSDSEKSDAESEQGSQILGPIYLSYVFSFHFIHV